MKNFKKFTAFVLALCIVFSLSVAAFAAEADEHTVYESAPEEEITVQSAEAATSGTIPGSSIKWSLDSKGWLTISGSGEAEPRCHAARCLKDEIADEQRPTDAQHDLADGINDGHVLTQIRKIQTHEIKQHGRKIFPAFQDQAIDPFDKALKEQFQQAARTSFSTG